MDYIDVHSIGVFGFSGRWRGEHVVCGFCGLTISLISSALSHCVWKWMALAYHSSIFLGTVSMNMIRFIKAGGIPAEK